MLSDTRSIYTPLFSGVLLGRAGLSAAGHRAHRSHPRSRREPVGLERGQRRDQHHDEARARHAGHVCSPRRSAPKSGQRGRALRRQESANPASSACSASTSIATRRSSPGSPTSDDWRIGHAGFRADWDASSSDALTLQGDVYRANIGQFGAGGHHHRPRRAGRRSRSARQRRQRARPLAATARRRARTCSCAPTTTTPIATIRAFTTISHTFDLDLQHRFVPSARHEIIWGLNYRYTDNRNRGKGIFALDPGRLARPAVQRLRAGPDRDLDACT